jgi:hypothetical protein
MFRLSGLFGTLAVGLAAAAATLSTTQIASAAPDPNPSAIVVPAGNRVFLVGHATGVQIYKCNGATKAWDFVAPRANLFDDNGKLVVTHDVGPTWKATSDGSTVKGAVVVKDGVRASVTVDPTAIPWLLLSAAPVDGAPVGLLTNTTFIQRVNTTGGLAPTGGCDATTANTQREIPYTANYRFWKKAGA